MIALLGNYARSNDFLQSYTEFIDCSSNKATKRFAAAVYMLREVSAFGSILITAEVNEERIGIFCQAETQLTIARGDPFQGRIDSLSQLMVCQRRRKENKRRVPLFTSFMLEKDTDGRPSR